MRRPTGATDMLKKLIETASSCVDRGDYAAAAEALYKAAGLAKREAILKMMGQELAEIIERHGGKVTPHGGVMFPTAEHVERFNHEVTSYPVTE